MEGQKTELKMIRMSEVESQEVKWLWYPFIPYGKLTIIQGDPGDGKTTLMLNIAAKLSKGESLDSDMNVQEPVNVIYQTIISVKSLCFSSIVISTDALAYIILEHEEKNTMAFSIRLKMVNSKRL